MNLRRLLPLLFALSLFPAVETGASAGQPAATVASKAHAVGDPLYVEWHGSWWKAKTVFTLPDDRMVVTYDGWADDYDEVVKRSRVRTFVTGPASYQNGEAVFVEWKGSWWAAHVTAVKGTSYAIHYDGWGTEWDETVGTSRLTRLSAPEG
ncbi:MAG: hypothetical protein ACXVEF_22420 [Polyangiales bacterium]